MATSLLTLLDDIASVLDDVAAMTKVAVKKTAGVLGDDLALNAQQVAGVQASRELPVVWAVAKGSAVNKLILVPAALLLSAFLPWLITPLLIIGGAYLCFEGFEKVAHKLLHAKAEDDANHAQTVAALSDAHVNIVEFEKAKIKGAVKTDFVLSAEIIVIALGTVQDAAFLSQVLVVTGIATIMTVGVYSFVAGIVKLDDAGLYLIKIAARSILGGLLRAFGSSILFCAPYLMKFLSIVGTAAMFIVGGGILWHSLPSAHEYDVWMREIVSNTAVVGPALTAITPILVNMLIGVILGGSVLVFVNLGKKLYSRLNTRSA